MLGRLLMTEGGLLLLPFVTGLIYIEDSAWWTLLTAVITFTAGFMLNLIFKKSDKTLFAREGFAIVALSWLTMSAFGALPFFLSGEISSYTDAFFETVSGLTTTGASVVSNVAAMSKGLLLWRSFTHWIGGMGILVFVMSILPTESGRNVHIMRAEVPGPIVGKVLPRIKDTAKILYLVYIALTVALALLLWCGDMSLFDSLIHAFGTAGTGGFGIRADSIASYSAYSQWVITVFMLLFAINFNLYYLILIKRVKAALSSRELWCFIGIVAVAVGAIAINLTTTLSAVYNNLSDTIRHSAFQVASIISTTGFTTVTTNDWPGLSKMILIVLMFVGGCAGSTAGGLKLSRVMMLFKIGKKETRQLIHPRSVNAVRFEGKTLDSATLHSVSTYIVVYVIIFVLTMLILSFEPFGFETIFTATSTCINNVGIYFGPESLQGIAPFSDFSTWILSFVMLIGRLEIFPMLLAFSPSTWAKK